MDDDQMARELAALSAGHWAAIAAMSDEESRRAFAAPGGISNGGRGGGENEFEGKCTDAVTLSPEHIDLIFDVAAIERNDRRCPGLPGGAGCSPRELGEYRVWWMKVRPPQPPRSKHKHTHTLSPPLSRAARSRSAARECLLWV